ncbi:MAG: hypothetical protein JWN94_899 [Betaproteobacteria bacterium]|nr:hypothetical protein [Betaproteobacteria bacterium]
MDTVRPLKRGFLNVLASAGGFIVGYAIPSLLVMAMGYAGSTPASDVAKPSLDDYAMMFYLVGVYALAGTVLFAAITATSKKWRERPLRKVALISALAGLAAQILNWTGLSLLVMIPLLKFIPRSAAAVVSIGVSGVFVALVMVLWFSMQRQPKRPVV